ncbi:hypothetical protein CHARACLAT_006488 [Characodon lateralis]|uniref:Uncharacterized protein n=1 Tax=Characodon lateralis TaxID=208331 RepID=A0ABU7DYV5_9TELE|nr:hypothetical protein [Characodon lateralis]
MHSLTHTHSYTDTQIGRQFEVKCLAQGHIDMWQEEAEIEHTTLGLQDDHSLSPRKMQFVAHRLLLHLGPGCRGSRLSRDAKTSLSPDTSLSSSAGSPRHSQASRET